MRCRNCRIPLCRRQRRLLVTLKSWRLVVRCAKCNRKVVLALVEHGTSLSVWRVVDRLRCHRRMDGAICGAIPRRVVLAECGIYGKTMRITREVVVRDD